MHFYRTLHKEKTYINLDNILDNRARSQSQRPRENERARKQ